MSYAAIEAHGLTKRYRRGEGSDRRTLSEVLSGVLGGRGGPKAPREEFAALDDVSFTIEAGTAVGVVGRNGAGKTTLLKVLSRITAPTEGSVTMRGRLASLLEVGTGFHPELTGRENIYLNGAMLGMRTAEVDARFDEIVEFAEIGAFLDTPVKRYSSGMSVRLAFAVAAHLRAEIMVIDEVLAVGDIAFQRKCLGKMSDVAHDGRTILFVSHNTAAVQQLTTQCLLLDSGRLLDHGPTGRIMNRYVDMMEAAGSGGDLRNARRAEEGSREMEFVAGELVGDEAGVFAEDQPLQFDIGLDVHVAVEEFRLSFTIMRLDDVPVGNSTSNHIPGPPAGEEARVRLHVPDHRLAPGRYSLILACGIGDGRTGYKTFDAITNVLDFEVAGPADEHGVVAEWQPNWGSVRLRSEIAPA